MKYKRVLLKLSGEALSSEDTTGIDFNKALDFAKVIKEVVDQGLELAIVVGGGNFWRGRTNKMINRCTSDYIGMLATTMNALALNDALLQSGVDSRVQTSIEMRQLCKNKKRKIYFARSGFYSTIIFCSSDWKGERILKNA